MPISGPDMANESKLYNAISAVSKEVLVNLSQTLCKENTSAKDSFEDNLFVSEDQIPHADAQNKSETSTTIDDAKKYRPHYANCTNCKKEFDVSKNSSTSCSYHPGMFNNLVKCLCLCLDIRS